LARLAVAVVFLWCPLVALADYMPVGYLSLDVFIPADSGSPGVNNFTVANLTGDPSAGGFAVPPTFPVTTSLTFKNSSLVLVSGVSSQTVDLGDIGPGFFSSSDLEFADTVAFSSATFTATLDATALQLDGGRTFVVSSELISTLLSPSSGDTLTAGTDFAYINVTGDLAPVPEPASYLLFGTMLFGTILFGLWPKRAR
jgi:hypothetical protein